ncbi:FMN-dependent NADH-azoreductase [Aliidiomarina haloalkalitolerans]|uniref:FMN dependent NADH:quinone oxidoreductase n=1 Tax=Aliidiomarina haloalkalitolerans TaxID=859059 RepID=A0A432VUV5_9GAMM|nr:NAD(P)H-dependent oxidoreductase [Aliidiomarina haloalkalitolerans]RUO20231.1 FMN-dependent NADH-azoreductase [Aliidiomarina haloalkalitolerans]
MNILHLQTGLFGEQSVSRQLGDKIVARLQQENSDATVINRDLITTPIQHLDAEILLAGGTEADAQTEKQQVELALTETLLEELFAADVVVIGAPMYNFSIPSQLKAWLDRVAQAGRTFRYTEAGPEGLVKGKKVYLASARGGIYSEGAAAAMEYQESYLKTVLGFLGMTDVTIIRAEGVNLSPEARNNAIEAASSEISALSA